LNGQAPNGPWSLFVYDDGTNDLGNIAGGWSLSLTTVSVAAQPPVISAVGNQTVSEDTTTGAIAFTVGDPDTATGLLVVSGSSSNLALLPTNSIVFGGSGSNRTVTLTPVANASGSATVTLTVSDGTNTASRNFVLMVTPVNDAPTISDIPDQAVAAGTSTLPIEFFISDVETLPDGLALSVGSSNPVLVPTNNIVLDRSGSAIALLITPAPGQTGVATITLSVSDGTNSVNTNFVLGVSALLMRTSAFTNVAPILINDSGAATPYPSVINVPGLAGTISNVVLTLRGLNHSRSPDLEVALVAPSGQTVLICAEAGSGGASNITLIFSDGASSSLSLSPLVSGAFFTFGLRSVELAPGAGAGGALCSRALRVLRPGTQRNMVALRRG